MPTRQDWLLRFIASPDAENDWVDRIRVMKGMFLFQHEHSAPAEINYSFAPYNYGPFTPEVYRDVEALLRQGLVAQTRDEKSYRVTDAGREYVDSIPFDATHSGTLQEIRSEVVRLSFRSLLKRVYEAHPDFAANTVARDVLR